MLRDVADEAVAHAMGRMGSVLRRLNGTLTTEDLRQEAWVAVLEAQRSGLIDVDDLRKAAEKRLWQIVRGENDRRDHEISVDFPNTD